MTGIETVLAGGVLHSRVEDDVLGDLRDLVFELGRRSVDAAAATHRRPQGHDDVLWSHLESTGLARLTSSGGLDAGPTEAALVLYGLACHGAAVALAETDLLAGWLAHKVGLTVPDEGPLTVAVGRGDIQDGCITGVAVDVPWVKAAAAVILMVRTSDGVRTGLVDIAALTIEDGLNLAGEPRARVRFDVPVGHLLRVDTAVYTELMRRGAWARCLQIVGALDMAARSSVDHCRDRVQFGQPLSRFQAVQQSLAAMAGEIERGRAAATLAVAAAAGHGFASPQTDYAVSVAKAALGPVVGMVCSTAHQLHGAIGVSIEHPLWLATTRAQSWVGEFGSAAHHARRLGQSVSAAADVWDWLIGASAERGE